MLAELVQQRQLQQFFGFDRRKHRLGVLLHDTRQLEEAGSFLRRSAALADQVFRQWKWLNS